MFFTDDSDSQLLFFSKHNTFRGAIEDIINKIYQNENKLELDFVKQEGDKTE